MNLYEDIAKRTNGEIYIGVVGPVRSGKSTFVKNFMDSVIIPNIVAEYDKERAKDVTPQSASGRTIMTTEPKFVPDEAIGISLGASSMKVRLIDCVGYMVEGAIGGEENGETRMVMTPWDSEPMEFERAAELGTRKVIRDHSTVGIVLTTDGTVCDLPRDAYIGAEEKIVKELKEINKPFVIVLNSSNPSSQEARDLAVEIEKKYNAPVALISALELTGEDFDGIIQLLLGQFGINELRFNFPKYFSVLENGHWLKNSIFDSIFAAIASTSKIDDVKECAEILCKNEYVDGDLSLKYNLGNGEINIDVKLIPELYYKIISELTGLKIDNDGDLFSTMKMLAETKKEFDKFSSAIDDVSAKGYGIVLPRVDDMTLEEPVMIKQGSSYGIKIKASAPSIHLIRVSIETEISPIVGSADQSQEIVRYMLDEYDQDPKKLWESNVFGKSVYELISDSLHSKLDHISPESRVRLSETLSRVINEGSNGLICIIL